MYLNADHTASQKKKKTDIPKKNVFSRTEQPSVNLLQLRVPQPQAEGTIQKCPADFKQISTDINQIVTDKKSVWAMASRLVMQYLTLTDIQIEHRNDIIIRLNKFIAEHWEELHDEELGRRLLELIDQELREIDEAKGTLAEEPSPLSPDPEINRKVRNERNISGGLFLEKTNIVDGNKRVVRSCEAGTRVKIIEDWNDSSIDTKKADYYKVEEEERSWIDASFKPINSGYVEKKSIVKVNRVMSISAAHYSDVSKQPLFPHPPTKEDIAQGGIADCYLLAAMISVVNHFPQHFVSHMKDNENGTVSVKQYEDIDRPVTITIKKSVPKKVMGPELFANSKAPWVPLYEKAYVAAGFYGDNGKLPITKGSYGMIENGRPDIAFMHILGKKAERKSMGDLNGLEHESAFQKELSTLLKDHYIENYYLKLEGDIIVEIQKMREENFLTCEDVRRFLESKSEPLALEKALIDWLIGLLESDKIMTGPLGSGEYTDREKRIFDNIEQYLSSNKHVVIFTRENISSDINDESIKEGHSAGEKMDRGLVGLHTYAVLDCRRSTGTIGGHGGRYEILLRNPWGFYGCKYEEKMDLDSPERESGYLERKEDENGEFWLDLAELVAYTVELTCV